MADTILHLQLTLGGGYKSTDPGDQPEVWQTGLRLYIGHDLPPAVGTLEAMYNVVEDEQSVDATDFTIVSNWRLEGGIADFDPVSYLTDQATAYAAAWFNNEALSAYAQGFWMKLAPVGVDGRQIAPPGFSQGSPALLTWKDASRPNGNGSSNTLPLQCSVVCSHRTAQTGKKGKGRQYVPAVDQNSIGADGRLTTDARAAMSAAQVAALEAASYIDPDNTAVIPSVISSSGSGSALNLNRYATISSVRVGDVVDTQRRRRNKLVESYIDAPVSYG